MGNRNEKGKCFRHVWKVWCGVEEEEEEEEEG